MSPKKTVEEAVKKGKPLREEEKKEAEREKVPPNSPLKTTSNAHPA